MDNPRTDVPPGRSAPLPDAEDQEWTMSPFVMASGTIASVIVGSIFVVLEPYFPAVLYVGPIGCLLLSIAIVYCFYAERQEEEKDRRALGKA
jgi:hypothetical protein